MIVSSALEVQPCSERSKTGPQTSVNTVRTLYTPKTHNLNRLRALAEDMEPSLKQVWPASTREEKRA